MKNNNKKRKPGAGLTMVGLLLIAAALFLTGKNVWDISKAKAASQAVLADLLPIIEAAEEKNDPKQPDEIIAKQETIIPDYILNPDMKMPTELIDGNEYIGIISIPDIDVVLRHRNGRCPAIDAVCLHQLLYEISGSVPRCNPSVLYQVLRHPLAYKPDRDVVLAQRHFDPVIPDIDSQYLILWHSTPSFLFFYLL